MDEYLTVKDIQEILKLGKNTVLKLVALPDFPKNRIGKSIRIPKSDFIKYMDSHKNLSIDI